MLDSFVGCWTVLLVFSTNFVGQLNLLDSFGKQLLYNSCHFVVCWTVLYLLDRFWICWTDFGFVGQFLLNVLLDSFKFVGQCLLYSFRFVGQFHICWTVFVVVQQIWLYFCWTVFVVQWFLLYNRFWRQIVVQQFSVVQHICWTVLLMLLLNINQYAFLLEGRSVVQQHCLRIAQ